MRISSSLISRLSRGMITSIKKAPRLDRAYKNNFVHTNAKNTVNNILTVSQGAIPLQCLKGGLPFLNSVVLASVNESTRAATPLINTFVDVNYLLFSSPLFGVAAEVGAMNNEENKHRIGEVVQAGWILGCLCSLPQMGLMLLNQSILLGMGQDPQLIQITHHFLTIYFLAMPLINIQSVTEQAILATKNVHLPFRIQALSLMVWGSMTYTLTFGALGIPALGVEGAAYAYLGRAFFNASIFHALLFYKSKTDPQIAAYRLFNKNSNLAPTFKKISRNGLYIFGLFLLETGEIYFPNLLAGLISHDALSAQLLVSQYQELILFVVSGIGLAAQVTVSKDLKSNPIQSARNGYAAIALAITLPVSYGLLATFYPEILLSVFYKNTDITAEPAKKLLIDDQLLMISVLNIMFISFRMVSAEALIGANATGSRMVFNMAISWLGIGAGYYLAFKAGYGLIGLNLGLSGGLCLSSLGQGYLWFKAAKDLSAHSLFKKSTVPTSDEFESLKNK